MSWRSRAVPAQATTAAGGGWRGRAQAAQQFAPPPPAAPQSPEVGGGETFLNRAVNAVPLGRLATDSLGAALLKALSPRSSVEFTQQAKDDLAAAGTPVQEAPETPGLVELYREVRDRRKERDAAGAQQHPVAAGLGTTAGIGLSLLAPLPVAKGGGAGATLGSRLGAGILTGAAYGGLDGLTNGDADLTRGDVGGALKDTAKGAALGGLLGLGGGLVTEGVRKAAPALRQLAIKQGKRVIQGNSDIAAATRKPLSDEAVEEVLASGGIRPLSTTQKTYERVAGLAEEQGAAYNQLVKELEARGVHGPDARELADKMMARGAELEPRTLNEAIPAEYLKRAEQVAGKAQENGRLGLSQAEDLKRSAQEMARYDRLTNSSTEEAKQDVASMLRQSVEDAIDEAAQTAGPGSEVERLGQQFVPTKQRLGRLLEARTFAEKGASKAEQRSAVGLKDYLLGAASGGPATALGTALLSSVARNRAPSTISSGAYALAKALEGGGAHTGLARALPVGDLEAALIEALRRQKGTP